MLASNSAETKIQGAMARAFGKKEEYAKEIMKANLERLAHLIKICGFLLQSKVYLFWKNPAFSAG